MSIAAVSMYPVVTEAMMPKLGINLGECSISYLVDGSTSPLRTEPLPGQEHIQSQLFIRDESERFDTEQHDMIISREVIITNPAFLFGPGGVACSDAEIGIALMWSSKASNQRGVFAGDSFRAGVGSKKFVVSGKFSKGQLRDKFQISVILYIRNPGTPEANERHLAQKSGLIIGEFGETTFFLRGNGSAFPIFIENEPGPLWRVECNWIDPGTDPFDGDYVKIVINSRHPAYQLIDSGKAEKFTPMMKEIIASALQIIIMKTLEDYNNILTRSDYDEDSICAAVKYFIDTFNLDTSSPEKLAYSLRRYLDGKAGDSHG